MPELDTIVKNHIFVGVADLGGSLSMLQHQTKLYLVNHGSLAYANYLLAVPPTPSEP